MYFQVDPEDPRMRRRIVSTAIRRASKWISLSEAKQMTGQVGGVSVHKRPLLCLKPDYILKPLQTDHRGIREIAFYEAIYHANQKRTAHAYSVFLNGKEPKKNTIRKCGELIDTLAVALAILLQDPVVTGSEEIIREAWKQVKKEVDALSRLSKFTAPYYGLVGQRQVNPESTPYGLSEDAHLLLQDLTTNFSKPNVIDLKIGTHSYEPDASEEKIARESSKYAQQALFGFRIVGMRVYDPNHPDADESNYVFYNKAYGRSLTTQHEVSGAFRRYLSAGYDFPNEEGVKVADLTDTSTVDTTNGSSINSSSNNNNRSAASAQVLRSKTIANLLLELRPLRRWFDENESMLRFYASSLLIVYEGDTSKTPDSGLVSVKMIDFGRVRRKESTDQSASDTGYQIGLQNLYDILTELHLEAKQG